MKHSLIRARADARSAEHWRHTASSCTAEFKILTSDDDMRFEAFNARERGAPLSRTAHHRIIEIAIFRPRKIATFGTSIGAKALAQTFNDEHARLS